MDLVAKIRDKAKKQLKRIVLPEAEDDRVKEAAEFIKKEKIAEVILLDKNFLDQEKLQKYAAQFAEMRKAKGISIEEAKETVSDPLYYGTMMIKNDLADGFVAGATHTTADVARSAIYCLGVSKRLTTISSSFLMIVPDCQYGEEGIFFFADCGIIPEPTGRQLAYIAISTKELAQEVLGITPRVAMLSYSTKGSATGRSIMKIRDAMKLVKEELDPGLIIDGELQVDAALISEIALRKDPESQLGGQANILIFPNLDAGNISYKLTQRLANARAIGPLIQGVNFPCSDLSRGCNVDDIIDCVAVTAIRAQNFKP